MTVATPAAPPVLALPGALDRQALRPALEAAAKAAQASGHALALITLDIDHFKPFQDEVGAPRAQQLLAQLALLLEQLKPASAGLAHLGADEFLLILPDSDLKAATALAEKLRQRIAEALALLDRQPPLTATLGVAASPPGSTWAAADLLALADARMSFAKKRLQHNLVFAGALPSDWCQRLGLKNADWPSLD
jgi:diguanylate cyclase (GGDEF)-like protein